MPKIIEHDWPWARPLTPRTLPVRYIPLHHSAGKGSPQDIHRAHLDIGYAGIGYNYVVYKGQIHHGRPEWAQGAHTYGFNNTGVAVCFVGNYDVTKTMPAEDLAAGRELIAWLSRRYPGASIMGHRQFPGNATACPGRYFPMKALLTAPGDKPTPEAKPTVVPESKRSELAQLMLTFALKSQAGPDPVPLDGWEGLNVLNPYWGRGKQLLAVRVSSRVLGSQKKSPKPTRALYEALKG